MSPALAAAYANCRARLAARGVRFGPQPSVGRPAVIAPEPPEPATRSSAPPLPQHPPIFDCKRAASGERADD